MYSKSYVPWSASLRTYSIACNPILDIQTLDKYWLFLVEQFYLRPGPPFTFITLIIYFPDRNSPSTCQLGTIWNQWHFQGLEKDQRLLSEEVNSLRSQLEKARMEKMNVEEQLTETQMMLQQEQRDHKILAQSRAREMEQWTDEREKSLHVVEEMTREVNT